MNGSSPVSQTSFKSKGIKIPREWEVVRLGEVLKLRNGNFPKSVGRGSIPIYGANGIMGYSEDFLVDNDSTIVIGRVGASGEVHLGQGKMWVSDNAIYSEKYDKSRVYLPFVFYLLKFKDLKQFAAKTTHPIITQSFLNSFKIPLPPLPEQKAIAKVLSTVDSAIQKVDEIIAKTERLKKGLMQRLLTRGIGHKEFKYSKELGCEIPKEWEVVEIKEISKTYAGGTPSRRIKEFYNGLIPWVKSSEVTQGFIHKTEERITEEGFRNSNVRWVDKNTVLVAMYGATAGKVGILKIKATTNQAVLAIPNTYNRFNPGFLYYMLSLKTRKLIRTTQGTGQPNLSKGLIDRIKLPLPPLPEQQKIAEILLTVDKKLELEKKRKEKLERIKRGLMNDLLTGKKRADVKKNLR